MEFVCLTQNYPELRDTGYLFQIVRDRPLSPRLHSHEFYEWFVVMSGRCVHFLNGEEQALSAGDCVLIGPHDTHAFGGQSDACSVMALSVTAERMRPQYTAYGKGLPETSQVFRFSGAALAYFGERAAQALHGDYRTRDRFFTALLGVFLGESECAQSPAVPPRLRTAMEAMRRPEHLRRGVPAFRELMHFSPAQLCRITRQYLGVSPQEFVLRIRLETACEWLQTDMPMEDIAEQIGFSSYSHFYQQFKRAFGVTPAQMRKHRAGLQTV